MVESLHQYSLCIRDFLKIPITVEYLLDMQQDGVQNLDIPHPKNFLKIISFHDFDWRHHITGYYLVSFYFLLFKLIIHTSRSMMKLANSLVVFVMTTFKKVRLFYIINKFIDINYNIICKYFFFTDL